MVAALLIVVLHIQTPDTIEVDPEMIITEESADAEQEAALVQEHVQYLATSKLDLNLADEKELMGIPGMSVRDAGRILAYRASKGRFRRVDDLLAAGVSVDAVRAIRPFVEVMPIRTVRTRVELLQRWTRRLEISRGFKGDSSAYAGSPSAWSTKIRISHGRALRAAATLEKDAGEMGRWNPPEGLYGYDFASASISLDGAGPFQRLILGDYTVRVGEGMLLQQGASVGNAVRTSPPRSGSILRPYSSSAESGFFRGLALRTRDFHGLSVAAFLSHRRLDGRSDSTGAIDILTSGYHRTLSERNARRNLRENASGIVLSLNRGFFGAGFAAYGYRHRAEQGVSHRTLTTGFLSFRSSGMLLSAEAARRGASISISMTAEYEPSENAAIWMRWMRAPATSAHLHTGIAAASGIGRAESARDGALSVKVTPALRFSVISRHRTYSSPRHTFALTSSIAEMRTDYSPREWVAVLFHARQKSFEIDDVCLSSLRGVNCTARLMRHSIRFQIDYLHSNSVRARTRIEAARVRSRVDRETANGNGFLIFEDIRFHFLKTMRLDFRLTFFDVGSYDARIYAVENDLLYSFSSPAPQGRGRRGYVLLTLETSSATSLQVKYATTSYEDVIKIGSGRDEIDGSRSRELKVQFRWFLK